MDLYRVYITFDTGDAHLDTDWCTQETLTSSLTRLFHGPVSKMGIIKEVKVVDTTDSIVFLVKDNKQVFPRQVVA